MRKITMLSMLVVVALLSVPSCAPIVSQQEYDRVSNELSAIQSQLESLQGKLAEAELLQVQNEELNKQFDAVKSEFEIMQAKYEELSTEYEELNRQYEGLNKQFEELSEQYDIIIEETAEINEEDVEQAVFKLVNQERINNGLNELMWGKNIYTWAISNSRSMATNKRLEYSEMIGWQDVFWGTGYSTTDGIANAALTVWKNHKLYERNFLSEGAKYCAVAVYKSGEIFYITYVADYFR